MVTPEQIDKTANKMNEHIDNMNRAFELYKDKVQELEDTCNVHLEISIKHMEENRVLKLFLARAKYLLDENLVDEVKTMFDGLNVDSMDKSSMPEGFVGKA